MRLVGDFHEQDVARRFSDVLYANGIESQVDQNAAGLWEIWVLDEDQIEKATALLRQYAERSNDTTYVTVARKGAEQRRHDAEVSAPKRNRVVEGRTLFYQSPGGYGILTIVLIAASVGVALLTNLGANDRIVRHFTISDYTVKGNTITWESGLPEIRRGQVWRLFTPIFVHFGFLHILFNMLWLRDLGSMIETHRGTRHLLLLVLVIAALSNVAQYLVSGPSFGGMSGVVYGLLGYIWMQGKFNPASRLALHPQTVTLMIIWFFLCLSGLMGSIANTVHGVGAVVGIAWGFIAAQVALYRRHN